MYLSGELRAHEKVIGFFLHKFSIADDVEVVVEKYFTDRVNESLSVSTGYQQDVGFHSN